MNSKLPEEVIKVHEKSLRLLDESETRLKHTSEMLRKAVVRLTIAARSDDDRFNQVLEQVKTCVKNDIDLTELDSQLDKLLIEINRPAGQSAAPSAGDFSAHLRQDLERYEFSSSAQPHKIKILGILESAAADHELSEKLLDFINDLAGGADETANACTVELSQVQAFADEVRAALELDTEAGSQSDASAILEELSDAIALYGKGRSRADGDDSRMLVCDQTTADSISDALIGLLNNMNLPESNRHDHQMVCRQLDSHLEGSEQWTAAIDNMATMVNKSIKVLQDEKRELESFIRKITAQLSDIDEYVRQSQKDRIDTVNQSTKLKDSVDSNVEAIKDSVESSDDLVQLRIDVQGHLSKIKQRVEEHEHTELEREETAKQGYAHIIEELARTQKETELLKEQLHESQQKMLRDPLTGLPNRLAYEERIALEMNRSSRNHAPFSLAIWDIDHFKKVNDTYGHDAGDKVLKLLAKIIVSRVRKVDMFARLGGEEFVLLMPDTDINGALQLNDQLRKCLEDSGFHYNGSPCPITSSVGLAQFQGEDTAEQLLQKADKALYQSKHGGRNCCTVYTENS